MSHSTEHLYLVSGEEGYDQADKSGGIPEASEANGDGDRPIRSLRHGRHPSSSPT
jgi:hypothetical protein